MNIFLGRYLQRAVIKGEDYWYTCHEVKQGIVSKLSVPAWNDQDFFGHACETQKLAENAAARAFLSDPEVQEVAPQLPPSMEKVKRHVRAKQGKRISVLHGSRKTRVAQQCKQRHEVYNQYQYQDSCRTAIRDGVA